MGKVAIGPIAIVKAASVAQVTDCDFLREFSSLVVIEPSASPEVLRAFADGIYRGIRFVQDCYSTMNASGELTTDNSEPSLDRQLHLIQIQELLHDRFIALFHFRIRAEK